MRASPEAAGTGRVKALPRARYTLRHQLFALLVQNGSASVYTSCSFQIRRSKSGNAHEIKDGSFKVPLRCCSVPRVLQQEWRAYGPRQLGPTPEARGFFTTC